MANKRKAAKKRDPNEISARAMPGEDKAAALARTVLRPSVQAALAVKEYGKVFGDLDLEGLVDALGDQVKAASEGDLGRRRRTLSTRFSTTWPAARSTPTTWTTSIVI